MTENKEEFNKIRGAVEDFVAELRSGEFFKFVEKEREGEE